mmetsp:Transcript_32792/g.69192  ORF Transcript_32792/g.69192 Transcript_32792/m.69192 type:complete len:312 (+) Transcript_32792:436-1371(+)
MNGTRAFLIKFHSDLGRYEVRLENESEPNATKAIKTANLTPTVRKPLPTGMYRGFADINDMHNMPAKLCELLLYFKGSGPGREPDFSPSEIIFTGYGSMAFQRMGEHNFMHFVSVQLEQMGGVLGLGNLCREAGEAGTEAVVFALLEGDEMYIDVLIQTMHWTGLIDSEDVDNEIYLSGFSNVPPTKLTADQESAPYVRTMKEGPILILECVAKYSFAPALWAALERSEFYHLLIQRFLRWAAREAKNTRDGKALGGKARNLLSSMYPDIAGRLNRPVSNEVADKILAVASALLSNPSAVNADNLQKLLGE